MPGSDLLYKINTIGRTEEDKIYEGVKVPIRGLLCKIWDSAEKVRCTFQKPLDETEKEVHWGGEDQKEWERGGEKRNIGRPDISSMKEPSLVIIWLIRKKRGYEKDGKEKNLMSGTGMSDRFL